MGQEAGTGKPAKPLTVGELAEKWIALPANPMKHPGVRAEVPEAKPAAGRNIHVQVSLQQASDLLACDDVPEYRRVRYVLALTSCMRPGELFALHFEDVDLDADTPLAKITKALPEEGPEGWATIGDTKNEFSVRDLPLHPAAVRALKAWKQTGWQARHGRPPKSTDPIFAARGPKVKLSRPPLPKTYAST
jgi:integrase